MTLPDALLRVPILLALLTGPPAVPADPGPQGPPDSGPHPQGEESQHEHAGTSHRRFDDIEHWIGVFDDAARDEWQMPERVVRELGIGAGDRVVDLGAGTGYFSVRLARAILPGGALLAVDTEPGMVRHLAERSAAESIPNLTPVLALPDDPMLPPAGADLVFLCDTYHHIDDRVEYLRRLRDDLRAGGRVALIDFHKREMPVGPPLEHKLARDHVLSEFEEAGYGLAEEKDFLPYQYFLIFRPRPEGPTLPP
ncbi:MAG: class I SAM-dependent methyltransferase [Acidobacteria bacterium]|nr:class I SAM-dependent methyltransferase [Acidobacteriota bacterium]